jgi:ABC-type transport system substrate-binding protein
MGRHMATVYEGWKNSILLMPMTPSDPNYDVYQTVLASTRKMFVSIQRPPGWDALLGRALAAVDDASIRARAQELTKMVYDEAMLAPLVWETKPAVKQKSVHDDKILAYSRYKWTPANAWLSK